MFLEPDGLGTALAQLRDEPRAPRLVWHGRDGRTELSGASLLNWTAKVAGLVRDELALGPGDVAAVLTVDSWQVAPVLLGCWAAGLQVTADATAAASVAFVAAGDRHTPGSDEEFVLSAHPLGLAVTDLAAHQQDFTTAVLPQSDRLDQFPPAEPRPGSARGERRVLLSAPDGGYSSLHELADALLTTLRAGGTLVRVAHRVDATELAEIGAAERTTGVIGVAGG